MPNGRMPVKTILKKTDELKDVLDGIYKELKNLTKISHLLITDEVKSVYEKARFSNHTISDDELKIIENAYYNSIEEIYNNLPRIKKPYYKFIKAIK